MVLPDHPAGYSVELEPSAGLACQEGLQDIGQLTYAIMAMVPNQGTEFSRMYSLARAAIVRL